MTRFSVPLKMVLKLFLDAPPRAERSGNQIAGEIGVKSNGLYRMLHRLEDAGWLASRWESAKVAAKDARPRRRYYRMTKLGREKAGEKVG